MTRHNHLNSHPLRSCDRRIDVIDLEPQQHTISGRFVNGIADRSVMMLYIPPVELQYQLARANEALVIRPAMRTLTIEQLLIPSAARFNIAHANQWLWMHG